MNADLNLSESSSDDSDEGDDEEEMPLQASKMTASVGKTSSTTKMISSSKISP